MNLEQKKEIMETSPKVSKSKTEMLLFLTLFGNNYLHTIYFLNMSNKFTPNNIDWGYR